MSRRRILHVIRPAEGGMKGHLLALCRGLIQRGYQVETACPADSSAAAELGRLSIQVYPIDLTGVLDLDRDARCIAQLREIIRRGRYDLVHFHGSKAGLVGRVAACLAGFPRIVLTVHNFVINPGLSPAKCFLYKYGEKFLSRTTSRIITVSEALKKDLVDNYGISAKKIETVYNGIDTSQYRQDRDPDRGRRMLGLHPGRAVIGTVARMAPQKGLAYFIEAAAEILRQRDALFILAGDGPLKDDLMSLAHKTGYGDKILFPGFVRDIKSFLAGLDVFVVPSVSEGLCITAIEAMAAGLPVIASRVGGLPEVVAEGETGLLVPPGDSRALAGAIVRLLEDPLLGAEMGRKGVLRAQQYFSVNQMIDRTDAVYLGVINERDTDF